MLKAALSLAIKNTANKTNAHRALGVQKLFICIYNKVIVNKGIFI